MLKPVFLDKNKSHFFSAIKVLFNIVWIPATIVNIAFVKPILRILYDNLDRWRLDDLVGHNEDENNIVEKQQVSSSMTTRIDPPEQCQSMKKK